MVPDFKQEAAMALPNHTRNVTADWQIMSGKSDDRHGLSGGN